LTADRVHQLLGTAHDDLILALVSAVLDHDPKRALELLGKAADEGLQLGELLEQLIEYWRDLMVVNCAGAEARDLSVPPRHRETLNRQAAGLKLDTILAGLDVLSTTKARLRGSNHGRTLLEMALVRLGRLDDLVSLSQLTQWLGQPSAPAVANAHAPEAPRAGGPSRSPEAVKKKSVAAVESTGVRASLPLTPDNASKVWQEILRQIGPMLASDLSKAVLPAIPAPNTLVIRFPMSYNAAREHCQQPANMARVEEMLSRITGQACKVRIESIGGDVGPGNDSVAEPAENVQSRYRRLRTDAMQEPLVKRAMEVLGAQLVDVDEGFGGTQQPISAERGEASESEEA